MRLGDVAYARSGDKGSSANIGVAVRSPAFYPVVRQWLTPQVVKRYFHDVCRGEVERFELPNVGALNFVLHEVLDGGAMKSLRLDPQGKTLCDSLMAMELESEMEAALSAAVATGAGDAADPVGQ